MFMKKSILGFTLLIAFIVSIFSVSYAEQKDISIKTDLDMDSKQEMIMLKVDEWWIDQESSFPTLTGIGVADGENSEMIDYIDFLENPDTPLAYYETKVIDINPKDKQKELLILRNSVFEPSMEAEIYTFKNQKLHLLGKVAGIFNGDIKVNAKTNRLEVFSNEYLPIQHTYYRTYAIEGGKLKEVTGSEIAMKGLGKEIKPVVHKELNVYSDKKCSKNSFTVKPKEKVTVLAYSNSGKYLKVKNRAGKVGYLPLVAFHKNDDGYVFPIWRLKQYPNTDMEPDIFTEIQHWG